MCGGKADVEGEGGVCGDHTAGEGNKRGELAWKRFVLWGTVSELVAAGSIRVWVWKRGARTVHSRFGDKQCLR